MVEKTFGLSLLKKYAKPGQALLLVLLVTEISVYPRLKIYKELNTLLLDISANISAKVHVASPQRNIIPLPLDLRPSGAEWLGSLVEQSNHVPAILGGVELMEAWRYACFKDWMNSLTLDILSITGGAISFSPYAHIVEWNEFLKSVQAHCQPLPTKVVYPTLWNIYTESAYYSNDLLSDS